MAEIIGGRAWMLLRRIENGPAYVDESYGPLRKLLDLGLVERRASEVYSLTAAGSAYIDAATNRATQ